MFRCSPLSLKGLPGCLFYQRLIGGFAYRKGVSMRFEGGSRVTEVEGRTIRRDRLANLSNLRMEFVSNRLYWKVGSSVHREFSAIAYRAGWGGRLSHIRAYLSSSPDSKSIFGLNQIVAKRRYGSHSIDSLVPYSPKQVLGTGHQVSWNHYIN